MSTTREAENMGRIVARSAQIVIDMGVLSLAVWLAFMFRFDWDLQLQMLKRLMFTWPYVVLLQYVTLSLFGVPRFSWRYISLREAPVILKAVGVSTLILLALRFVAGAASVHNNIFQYAVIPIGVILGNFVLAFVGITGVRLLRRMLGERSASDARRALQRPAVKTLLIGAGEAGVMVAKEIRARPDLGMDAVGFLDDDTIKVGSEIHGLRVLGSTRDIALHCQRTGAEQVLITIANAPGSQIREIKKRCDQAGVSAKIIPGIYEIVGGKVNLQRIRPVAIQDLLRRDPVQLDEAAIADFVQRKVVLVTGAGGSIGAEICRQLAAITPSRLLLVERFEGALFEIHGELRRRWAELDIVPCIADVTDTQRMRHLLAQHKPEVIFHAAAHKHVPMMEYNPGEAIKNNVLGTKNLAELAAEHQVGHFVMISTDKAVNPTSVMGASKRVAELFVQGMSQRHAGTVFVSVRFGNVLGSSGSVVPIFKRQIEAGGPVTVTHPDMKRYFMTIPEATQLVLQAATMGHGGEVFILDMGEPVKIVDLARDLIRLSGFEPERDIEIQFSGVRPGEKLFEELSTDAEKADKTLHDKIFVGHVAPADWAALQKGIAELAATRDALDERAVYRALRALIPEFSGKKEGDGEGAQVIRLGSG